MKRMVQATLAFPSFVLVAVASTAIQAQTSAADWICHVCVSSCSSGLNAACAHPTEGCGSGFYADGCFVDEYDFCVGTDAYIAKCVKPE